VADYDHWAALGHPDWSYESVQPFFVMSEKSDQPKSSFRGTKGAKFVFLVTLASHLTLLYIVGPWKNRKSNLEKVPLRWSES
jgi:hypothetical protein